MTRNRPTSLRRCLESFHRQSLAPIEIVISDDSQAECATATLALASAFGCRYTRGPRKGLYANRNHAALCCRGTHILTADDDHEHPPDYLEKVHRALTAQFETVWSMGEVYNRANLQCGGPWHGPGQICANGALVAITANGNSGCWAIADGATVYPKKIFASGLRFFDACRFGDSYKEFGCLLHWLGIPVRPLTTTGVLHHMNEVGRSFLWDEQERAAQIFAMLMFSFVYQPKPQNQAATLAHLLRHSLLCPGQVWSSLSTALRWVTQRRKQVLRWKQQHLYK
ncbi:MAG TPA: glycosyltransferase family 2 protein [Verrucomicrobiae bacterium]|nr:glycosyltransferase family 2 protein [Verrucomicrobiae bacterium]